MTLRHVIACSLTALCLLAAGCPGETKTKKTPGNADNAPGDTNGDTGGDTTPTAPPPKPFDLATAKTPWRHSKVGDWATYNMISAKKEMKFEITKVEGNFITFTVTDTKSGEKLNEPTIDMSEEEGRYKDPMTYDAYAKDKDGKEITPYKEKVTVAGKEIEALVIKRAKSGMGSTELWIAEKDVRPFNQCAVKSIRNGKLEMELLDFGSAK